jgi:serine/threonine protein kinase/formylglycine-generating enzyme required for sulfatase activity
MTNLIGQSLGRYHILEQLGEGGMATVYKAYDTRLERDVAIKVIRRGAFPSEQLDRILKRFEREAKALAKLSHPNIIKVIDYGEHENSPYLVMEYLPGGTLKTRLGRPMPWQEAARIVIPIAEALDYAHEQKIIHRDIKPSNILLTAKGQPMLTDFGIAKMLETEETATLTGTGIGVGTPEYMSPEQWTGTTTTQSDIYSLGVVLYEIVTGRKPYMADTPAAILLKQASEPLPRPGKFVSNVPSSLENILIKALARDPQNRYKTMQAFSDALQKLVQGELAQQRKAERSKPLKPELLEVPSREKPRGTAFNWKPMAMVAASAGLIGLVWYLIKGPLSSAVVPDAQITTPFHTTEPSPTKVLTHTPQPSPTGTQVPLFQTGDILFETNFEQGIPAGFEITSKPESWMTIEDSGNTILKLENRGIDEARAFIGRQDWSDYRLEFKTRFETRETSRIYGISIGVYHSGGEQNAPNWYQIWFAADGVGIHRSYLGKWTTLGHITQKLAAKHWYAIRADAFQDTIALYVDDKLVLKVVDPDPLLKGRITFSSGEGMNEIIYFDDIRVTKLVPNGDVSSVNPTQSVTLSNEITDVKGVPMMLVPAGEFTMGSVGMSVSRPEHTVYLNDFYMDKYEVTNAFYKACVETNICMPPRDISSLTRSSYYNDSQFEDYPVIYVDWNQASTYCKWRGADLPTEAQWEKAARGTDGRPYPWGGEIDCNRANYAGCVGDTNRVGSYESGISPYGIYDMAGNVWEWVADWYDAYPGGDPNASVYFGKKYRGMRGGTWRFSNETLYTFSRYGGNPVSTNDIVGFRCARSAN